MEARQTAKRGASDRASELERTRRELRALQRRFRSIIERTADGILVIDADGVVRFVNQAAAKMFGRSRRTLVGSPFGHPLVVGERTEIDLVRSGRPMTVELRATGTEWDGEPASIVSLRDITDRKRAEEHARRLLREQVARAQAEEAAARSAFLSEASRRLFSSLDLQTTLQTVVSLAADGFADLCVLDVLTEGRVQRFTATAADDQQADLSRAAEAYPLDPDEDSPQARVYREGEPLLVPDVTDEWLRSAARSEEHLEVARSLGIRSLICVPLRTGHRCVGVLTAARWRDDAFADADFQLCAELGRRAALAIENARLYHQAEAANRAKSNFLSVVSHELRTPLSAVIGYTDLMDRGVAGEPTDAQRRFLGRIRSSSNHLLQIIEEILAFAGTEDGQEHVQRDSVTLQELMDDVATMAEPLSDQRDVEFKLRVECGEAELHTDAGRLRQILLNLVSNAFKFTSEGEVSVSATIDGDDAVFTVRDTGIGIPRERHEAIFERFSQLEDPMTRRAGGTGLGLTVARSFARLLGGDVRVDSTPGDGATFTVRVPATYTA